jgi:nucleolar protein 58
MQLAIVHSDHTPHTTQNNSLKLKAFAKFENTTEALSAVTALVEGKMSKSLKSFLKDELSDKDLKSTLVVGDAKLGMLS